MITNDKAKCSYMAAMIDAEGVFFLRSNHFENECW